MTRPLIPIRGAMTTKARTARRSAYLARREKYLIETGRTVELDMEFGIREKSFISFRGMDASERHSRRRPETRCSVVEITAGRTAR